MIAAMMLGACILVAIIYMIIPSGNTKQNSSQTSDVVHTAATVDKNAGKAESSPTAAVESEDETMSFQGHWVAVEESIPVRGPLPSSLIEKRKFSLLIQDHNLEKSAIPGPSEEETLSGSISFQKTGNERTFTVRGIGGDGERRRWHGLYSFEENFLYISYRMSEVKGTEPIRPLIIQNNGERGIFYAKLRRTGPRRHKKQ